MPTEDEAAVLAAHEAWFVALNAMLDGDPAPFADLYSHAGDVCYMPAEGGLRVGWETVWRDWQSQARLSRGGRVEEIRSHAIVQGDAAVVMTVEEATLKTAGDREHRQEVRETSVFRREGGRWKMVAHHADALAGWTAVAGAARNA